MKLYDWRMKNNGMKQKEFAKLAGISQAVVSCIENGKPVSASSCRKVIKATNGKVTIKDLWSDV